MKDVLFSDKFVAQLQTFKQAIPRSEIELLLHSSVAVNLLALCGWSRLGNHEVGLYLFIKII